jgi:hypothetical protein
MKVAMMNDLASRPDAAAIAHPAYTTLLGIAPRSFTEPSKQIEIGNIDDLSDAAQSVWRTRIRHHRQRYADPPDMRRFSAIGRSI